MAYFAGLALLAGYCDRRPILVATVVTAVHHLALNYVLPEAVFASGSDLGRVVLHAVILVVEAATLVWVASVLEGAAARATTALQEADEARQSQQKEVAARHRLEAEAAGAAQKEREALAATIEGTVGTASRQLDQAAATLVGASDALGASAGSAAEGAEVAAHASSSAASGVQSVAAAAEELAATVAEIARQVAEASTIAETAVQRATATDNSVRPSPKARNR